MLTNNDQSSLIDFDYFFENIDGTVYSEKRNTVYLGFRFSSESFYAVILISYKVKFPS